MGACELLHIVSNCGVAMEGKFPDCSNAALHCALVCVCCTVRHKEVLINHIATQHTTLRHAKLVTLHQT